MDGSGAGCTVDLQTSLSTVISIDPEIVPSMSGISGSGGADPRKPTVPAALLLPMRATLTVL